MSEFYFYHVHGLNIKTSLIFPELISGKVNHDVLIHFDEDNSLNRHLQIKTIKKGFNKFLKSTNDVTYLYNDEILFRVKYGNEIIVNSTANMDLDYIRDLILGPGLGTLLMQRGCLVLHASSIEKDGAVAFMGCCGCGKSTIASKMNSKGYPFITDDVLSLRFDEDHYPFVFSSFPRSKLWDDTIEHMNFNLDSFQRIHPEVEKYVYEIGDNFSFKPVPLKMIYVLENAMDNEIVPLNSQNALVELIKYSYAINLFGSDEKSLNLLQCANLVKNVPVKLLKIKKSLDELEDLTYMLEKDISSPIPVI